MFYDNGDHYTLALYVNSKNTRNIQWQEELSIAPAMAIGFADLSSHERSGALNIHIYTSSAT